MHLIVLMVGLEPTIPCGSRIVSAMRIPIPPHEDNEQTGVEPVLSH